MRAPETVTATREVQKEQCMDPEAVSGTNRPCNSAVRKRTLACTKTLTQSVPASAETIAQSVDWWCPERPNDRT